MIKSLTLLTLCGATCLSASAVILPGAKVDTDCLRLSPKGMVLLQDSRLKAVALTPDIGKGSKIRKGMGETSDMTHHEVTITYTGYQWTDLLKMTDGTKIAFREFPYYYVNYNISEIDSSGEKVTDINIPLCWPSLYIWDQVNDLLSGDISDIPEEMIKTQIVSPNDLFLATEKDLHGKSFIYDGKATAYIERDEDTGRTYYCYFPMAPNGWTEEGWAQIYKGEATTLSDDSSRQSIIEMESIDAETGLYNTANSLEFADGRNFYFLISSPITFSNFEEQEPEIPDIPTDPYQLYGDVSLTDPEALRYDPYGYYENVDVTFAEAKFAGLQRGHDYEIYIDGYMPGDVTLHVTGMGQYHGEITKTVTLLKGIPSPEDYAFRIPEETTYNGAPYYPSVELYKYQLSYPVFTYINESGEELNSAIEPGTYHIWANINENSYYEALPPFRIADMTIYGVDTAQIKQLKDMEQQLMAGGFKGFSWNEYYDESNLSHYSPWVTFSNGKIKKIYLYNRFNKDSDNPFPFELLKLDTMTELDLANNNIVCHTDEILQAAQKDPEIAATLSRLTYMTLGDNGISGDIGAFILLCNNMEYLYLHNNRLTEASLPLNGKFELNYQTQQSDLSMDIDLTDPTLSPEKLMANIPTLALFNPYDSEPYGALTLTISETNDFSGGHNSFGLSIPIYSSWNRGEYTISNPNPFGNSIYRGPMQNRFYLSAGGWYSGYNGIKMTANVKFMPGDMNIDMSVNVADLQAIANNILRSDYNYELFNFTAADSNADERVDARDLVRFINQLMAMAPQPFATPEMALRKSMRAAGNENDSAPAPMGVLSLEDGMLMLETTAEVGALDITVASALTPEWTDLLRSYGLAVAIDSSAGRHRLTAYSPDGASIPAGHHLLARLVNGELTGGSLSSPEAREIPLTACLATTVEQPNASAAKAYRQGNKILISLSGSASWQLISADGHILANGNAEAGVTSINAEIPAGSIVILLVNDADGIHTLKF